MGSGNDKKVIELGADGLPSDGVDHVSANEEQLRRYQEAASNPLGFKTPLLHDLDDPRSHLILGLTDGTGNDAINDPLHASNVGKLKSFLERSDLADTYRIHAEYVEGPGTQRDALTNIWDGATGDTSMARAEKMYWDIARQADRIFRTDPDAKIKIGLIGFSRGSSEEAVLARMLHERGLPDLRSEIRTLDADGNVVLRYGEYHQAPGRTPLAVGLYDPVATGALEYADRRLPPSTVSAFQITSADERRGTFPSDRLLFPNEEMVPDRVSADGRFREVVLPGKHSNMGGGYLRDGISTKNYNLMADYLNSMVSQPVIPRLPETDDPRLNVFHESHQGNLLFRLGPKAARDTPKGQVHDIVPDRTHIERSGEVVIRFQSAPERMDPIFDHYLASARVKTQSPLPPSSTAHGDVLLARVMQDTGYEVKPYEIPLSQRPTVRIGGALGVVGVATAVADAVHTGQRFDTLLAQDNLLGAQHELRNFAANNSNAWVAAYTVSKLGAELGGRRGVQGAIAGGIAGGIVGYVLSDKAMAGLDAEEIAKQVDSQGRHWHFNGRQWVKPMEADLSASGSNPVQEVNFSADLDTRRELDYKATNKSVEIGLSRLPQPVNPYSLDASAGDGGSVKPANWIRDADSGQWHRNRVADVDANGGNIYDYQTATPERAAQLNQQAAQVIEANIANGPAHTAARYQVSHRINGWEGPEPAAVSAALDPNNLQGSDGAQYRLAADGKWRHGDEVATGNLATELTATREALQPKLQSHEQTMAQLPAWQRPTQAQEDVASLAATYQGFGVRPNPESLAAIQVAINTTREQQGLDPATTSLALDPNAPGVKRDIHSPIMHLHTGNDGAVRVAATTTAQDVELARQELRAQGVSFDTPLPDSPKLRIASQSPQEREAQEQATREANRQGLSQTEVAQVATLAAVQVRAPRMEPARAERVEVDIQPEREKVVDAETPASPTQPITPVPPAASVPDDLEGLRLGDQGPDVAFLQHRLQRAGVRGPEGQPLPQDGNFGPETDHAVRQFQQAQGLPATGVADATRESALSREQQARTTLSPTAEVVVQARQEQERQAQDAQARQERERQAQEQREQREAERQAQQVQQQEAREQVAQERRAAETLQTQERPTKEDTPSTSQTPQPPLERDSVRLGDRGQDVEILQYRLQRVGATGPDGQPVPQDGRYGVETEYAVREFQQAQGLPATGVADQNLNVLLAHQQQAKLTPITPGKTPATPTQAAPEQVIERAAPDERQAQTQAISEAQRQGASPAEVEQVATVAAASVRATPSQPEVETSGYTANEVARSSYARTLGTSTGRAKPDERDEEQERDAPRQDQVQTFPTEHRDHALFLAIQQQLPKDTPDEKTAEVMHDFKQKGRIERADEFGYVRQDPEHDRVIVFGKQIGFSSETSLSKPAPPLEETLQQTQKLDEQRAQELALFQIEQERINRENTGPKMSMTLKGPGDSDGDGSGDGGGGGGGDG